MEKYNRGDIVWCNTGKPSYEPDGNFVGMVMGGVDGIYSVEKPGFGKRQVQFHESDLSLLTPCPIDNAANLHSDWIEEELLSSASFNGYYYCGWLLSFNYEYPVKCNVTSVGSLMFKKYVQDNWTFKIIIERINDLFNCNEKTNIVAAYITIKDTMVVKFYYLPEN